MRFACLFVIALTLFATSACDAIDNLTATATPKALTFPDGWEDLPRHEKAEASFDHYINTTPGCDEESINRKSSRADYWERYGVKVQEKQKCLDEYLAIGGREVICEHGIPDVVRSHQYEIPTNRSIGLQRNGSMVITYHKFFCYALTLTPIPPTPIPPTPTLTPYESDDDIAPEIPVEAQTYK